MDPSLQASFIPKKPLIEHSSAVVARPTTKVSIFFVISLIIFLVAIALGVAVFFYNSYLNASITGLQNSIVTTEGKYTSSSGALSSYTRMNTRLVTANSLLSGHVAVSPVFSFLGQNTAKGVRFTSFSLSLGGSGQPAISLTGQAASYNSVSVQSNVFSSNPLISDPIFSGLGLDNTGNVTFQVSANLNPKIFMYKDGFNGQQTAATSTASVSSASTSGSTFGS